MKNRFQILLFVSFLGSLLSLPAWGQQDSAQPGQDNTQLSNSSQAIQGTNQAERFDPDERPLAGDKDLSFGIPAGAENVLNASIRVDERLDSNPRVAGTKGGWQQDQDVFGSLSLNRIWKRNMFTAGYDGGGIFYPGGNIRSTHFANLSELLTWRRWSLTLSDEMFYAPETPFGMPGPQLISLNGTNIPFQPNQSILTNQTTRISNTNIVQVDYALSRGSSITGTGSYGLLHYTTSGAPDSHQDGGTLGYNYALTPRDKVAVTYGYEQLYFNSSNIDIQTTNLSYAHQVTGRWSAEVAAGAQLAKRFFSGVTRSHDNLYPDGHASLMYERRRNVLTLSASKSLLSGMGLFVVTNTTIAQIVASRILTRKLHGFIGGGYAQNSVIGENHKIRSGFATLGLERTLGRHAALDFNYHFQRQTANTVCSGSVCAGDLLRHTIGVGFAWNFSPVVFH
jgi:hypothetical protein